jgi:hypothetical protein
VERFLRECARGGCSESSPVYRSREEAFEEVLESSLIMLPPPPTGLPLPSSTKVKGAGRDVA